MSDWHNTAPHPSEEAGRDFLDAHTLGGTTQCKPAEEASCSQHRAEQSRQHIADCRRTICEVFSQMWVNVGSHPQGICNISSNTVDRYLIIFMKIFQNLENSKIWTISHPKQFPKVVLIPLP